MLLRCLLRQFLLLLVVLQQLWAHEALAKDMRCLQPIDVDWTGQFRQADVRVAPPEISTELTSLV